MGRVEMLLSLDGEGGCLVGVFDMKILGAS